MLREAAQNMLSKKKKAGYEHYYIIFKRQNGVYGHTYTLVTGPSAF